MSNSIRICFKVKEPCRFVSHLDKMRSIERAIRRAKLPIAYSQGFNQRPRFSFGPPLPVGLTSDAEYADFHLAEYQDAVLMKEAFNQVLPTGFEVVEAINLPAGTKTLMSVIHAARYSFSFLKTPTFINERVQALLDSKDFVITKHTKKGLRKQDIRSLIYKLELGEDESQLFLECACGSRNNLRPMDLLTPLNIALTDVLIHREALWASYLNGTTSTPFDVVKG